MKTRPVFNIRKRRQPEEAVERQPGGRKASAGSLTDAPPRVVQRDVPVKIKCEYCNRSYSEKLVEKHRTLCAVIKAPKRGVRRKELEHALDAARRRPYVCGTCGYHAVNSQSLTVHVKRCKPNLKQSRVFTELAERLKALEVKVNGGGNAEAPLPARDQECQSSFRQTEEELTTTTDIKTALSAAQSKVAELEAKLEERQALKAAKGPGAK
eukprot:TRINITY_DN21284_c0_g1_i1.p3 TRINITY_DN21284_c0_g1~~TRINITY_DN21284_c0_g1_i1.p3  ORF type:complete len:211 (+),score=17.81 TRINITY_DN21284_c0_g1_i1:686-1318(+)